jgi:hypothetical protein
MTSNKEETIIDPEMVVVLPDTTKMVVEDDSASTATAGTTPANPPPESSPSASSSTNPEAQTPSLTKIFNMARPEFSMLFLAFLLMVAAESTGLIIPLIIANACAT